MQPRRSAKGADAGSNAWRFEEDDEDEADFAARLDSGADIDTLLSEQDGSSYGITYPTRPMAPRYGELDCSRLAATLHQLEPAAKLQLDAALFSDASENLRHRAPEPRGAASSQREHRAAHMAATGAVGAVGATPGIDRSQLYNDLPAPAIQPAAEGRGRALGRGIGMPSTGPPVGRGRGRGHSGFQTGAPLRTPHSAHLSDANSAPADRHADLQLASSAQDSQSVQQDTQDVDMFLDSL